MQASQLGGLHKTASGARTARRGMEAPRREGGVVLTNIVSTVKLRKDKKTMKRNWSLPKAPRTAAAVLVAAMLLGCAVSVNAAEEGPEDGWRFAIIPYLYLPNFNGSMNLEASSENESGRVDTGPADYLENLKSVLMLDLQARKGRWSFLADVIYLDFSDEDQTAYFPAGGGIQTDTGLQALVFELAGAYSVFRKEYVNLDLLAGARYAGIESEASLDRTAALPGGVTSRNFSDESIFVDPIVGFKGTFELGKKWHVPYYFDIGGFTVDSDLTLQAFGGIGYRFCDWFTVVLGYRYLYYDFGDGGLLKDLGIYGTMLGLSFTF